MFYKFRKVMIAALAISVLSLLFTGCGKVNASDTALTVNGETLSAGTASTYVRFQQAEAYQYQSYMYSMYGMETGDSFWDNPYSEEEGTYGEYFLNQAKEDLTKMVLIRQHAADYGYSLNDNDKAKISEAAAKFISDNGSVAKWIGADQASVENLLSLYNYQIKTRDLFLADVDREVSDEEAGQSTILYARMSKTAPDDFEGTEEEYAAQAKDAMTQMLEQSKTADLEQIEAEEHAEEETEDASAEEDTEKTLSEIVSDEVHAYTHVANDINENITVTSAHYTASAEEDDALDAELVKAAKTLTDGNFYDSVIETDDYYYVVKMEATFDESATESERNSIISEREQTAYDELIQSWIDSSDVIYGKSFDKITVSDKMNYVVKQN